MKVRRYLGLVGIAALSVLGGCSEEPRGTSGQLGTLRFEYSTAGACAGCAIDREVLAGSQLDIDVFNMNLKTDYGVRSTAPDVAEFAATTRCRFAGEDDCRDGISVSTKTAGDADLEVFDEWTGTVLDRVTIKVREASTLEASVRVKAPQGRFPTDVKPTADGVFEVKVGSDVEIAVAAVRSGSGASLIATSAAIQSAYADERVVGPRPAFHGAAPTEYAKAKSPGVASVALVGAGAREELRFRVVR